MDYLLLRHLLVDVLLLVIQALVVVGVHRVYGAVETVEARTVKRKAIKPIYPMGNAVKLYSKRCIH